MFAKCTFCEMWMNVFACARASAWSYESMFGRPSSSYFILFRTYDTWIHFILTRKHIFNEKQCILICSCCLTLWCADCLQNHHIHSHTLLYLCLTLLIISNTQYKKHVYTRRHFTHGSDRFTYIIILLVLFFNYNIDILQQKHM